MTSEKRWFLKSNEVIGLGREFGDIPIHDESSVRDLLLAHFAGSKNCSTLDDAKQAVDTQVMNFKEGETDSFWIRTKSLQGWILYR